MASLSIEIRPLDSESITHAGISLQIVRGQVCWEDVLKTERLSTVLRTLAYFARVPADKGGKNTGSGIDISVFHW